MILILSIERDLSTSNVIEWLLYYNKEFTRINEEDALECEININNTDTTVQITKHEIKINFKDFKSHWYRRGNFMLNDRFLKGDNSTIRSVNVYHKQANEDIKQYLHSYVDKSFPAINKYTDNDLNKLTELSIAKEVGLSVPSTIITTKRTSILAFFDLHKRIITKSIKGTLLLEIENSTFYWHTLMVTRADIEGYPENFAPAKFQQYVEKAFELRVFYLSGHFYASAIFSQKDEETKVDFRNYNATNPNRVVPYILPEKVASKLKSFMVKLNLNSGSIDIIVTPTGEYVFIEVNPIGQFSQVSYPCNYYLEKQIALSL